MKVILDKGEASALSDNLVTAKLSETSTAN